MDKNILVEKNIEEGKILVEALDRSLFTLKGALWYYYLKHDEWRLLLVSPLVDRLGPKRSYTIIQNVIQDLHLFSISIIDISVLSPKNRLIQLLKIALSTGPRDISKIRFTRNTINNVFVEDALIYRLA
ncbi:unnamed protein product [marine sediment metagenome]|uniref:Uncharacterized protein n=1 Tax=marine sediment metagenome TaxID=412755 RepID=X1LBQ7_9ZZZZ